jgi:nitrate reductase molybdenum cofactor assembly chaperone
MPTTSVARAASPFGNGCSGGLDLYDAQERYVSLFDRTRTLSLHLFEHVHGESRDRGQAMVDLGQMYERQGFEIDRRRDAGLPAAVPRVPVDPVR